MIVEHSFGVPIVCIRNILFELYLMEKKKERKKEEEQQIEIFAFDSLYRQEKSWDCGIIF